jgi:hypothetical protein
VESGGAFEARTVPPTVTLHALTWIADHHIRNAPEIAKLFLHESLDIQTREESHQRAKGEGEPGGSLPHLAAKSFVVQCVPAKGWCPDEGRSSRCDRQSYPWGG